jgi:hypothetical protein
VTERRASPRLAAPRRRMAFRVEAPDGATLAYAALEDASPGGVRLLTARACARGPAVLVPVWPHPLAGRRFAIRVERSGALGGGFYAAGPFDPPVAYAVALALAEAE